MGGFVVVVVTAPPGSCEKLKFVDRNHLLRGVMGRGYFLLLFDTTTF